jgi:hypothetical protein
MQRSDYVNAAELMGLLLKTQVPVCLTLANDQDRRLFR